MAFTITDSDGNISEEVWSCTECIWLSTKKHCKSTEDGPACVLCGAPCEQGKTITKSTGMSDFKYRELLDYLTDEVTGVGSGTRIALENHFENGDDFVDAAEDAYDNRNWEALSCVKGVGDSTAERIALGLAEKEDWSGGKAENKFELS